MRVVVVFVLALLNVSLLLWQFYRPQAQEIVLPATDPGVPELVLVAGGPKQIRASACRALGPYADAAAARAASERLQGLGLHPRTEVVQRRESWFRVLLGPVASAETAQGVAAKMRSQGILDVQVLSGGDTGNSVSLGLYRDRAAAERRAAQLAGLGEQARIEAVDRDAEAYWVSVSAAEAVALSPAQLGAAGAGQSGVALTPRPCP